tara:strand:+ start:923 stop:1528 length:606 start_codon:yes stop_codon:yes gene_type:complete
MSSSNSSQGTSSVIPVESAPFVKGTSSPQQSALESARLQSARQNEMNKVGGKRGYKKKYRGGAQTVPTFSSTGPAVGAGGQTANGASVNSSIALTQGGANGVCDTCYGANSNSEVCQGPQCNPSAMKGGSSCNSAGGLIPNGQTWGCLSGGKKKSKKTKTKKSKTKKAKKSKTKKTKKTKKSKTKKSKKTKKTKRTKKSKK